MDLLSQPFDFIWNMLTVLVPFLFVLTIVVFIHELGHFLVARWCGVTVKAFSIGFGKEIWGFNDRHGTRWRLAWLPLGGYVKFVDDENSASMPSRRSEEDRALARDAGAFHAQPLASRAAVVAAGPIANFLLAVGLFAAIFGFVGISVTIPRVDEIIPGGAAEKAGFKPGDLIKAIDGKPIETFADLQRIVSDSADRELLFTVDRGGAKIDLKATPTTKEQVDRFGNKHRLGMIGIKRSAKAQEVVKKSFGPLEAIWAGVLETKFIIEKTLGYIYKVIAGRESADQLGGPIRIAEVSGQVASAGFVPLLHLTAVLSVSIGLLNLFPIPLLDGGHLLFYAIEAVRRKPLSERAQEIGFRIGMAVVLMLMFFATWNDLGIVKKWFSALG